MSSRPAVLVAALLSLTSTVALAGAPEQVPQPQPQAIADPGPAALPSYDAAPQAPELDPPTVGARVEGDRNPPPDGQAGTVIGAMLLGGAVVVTAASGTLLLTDDHPGLWITGLTLGSLAVPAGILALSFGRRNHSRHRPWRIANQAPARGSGLLAGGVVTVSGGALGLVLGGVAAANETRGDTPFAAPLLSLGGVSTAIGITLLCVGGKRRRRYLEWDSHRITPQFGLLAPPDPKLRPAGATIGVTGRF